GGVGGLDGDHRLRGGVRRERACSPRIRRRGHGVRRAVRRALIVAGAATAGAVAAVAAERYLVQRARSRPDPEAGEPLDQRPGSERRVASFDGTELAVNVVGPEGAPAVVLSHGFTLDLTTWYYQWQGFLPAHSVRLVH